MKNWILLAALAGGTAGAATDDRTEALKPPMAKKVAKVETLHGEKLVDDYFWLRDRKNPEVRAYLESENAYADAFMKPTETLQSKLYDEMLGRIKETDLSVPFRLGEFLYYSRTEKGKQYPIYCRKRAGGVGGPQGPPTGSAEAAEQVMLDLNELARGERFMAVAELEVSDDGNLLAYTTDNVGFREYRLHVKDLSKGKDFPEIVEKVSSAAWAADNKTLFYTVDDHAKRPYRMYRHTLGEDPRTDVLVFEEKDEMYRANVHRSRSRKVLFLVSGSHTADEWRFLDSDKPAGLFTMISPREKEHEYAVDHRGDVFYIRTNKRCRNFHVVVLEREDGLPRIRVIDLATGAQHRVYFPEPVYAVGPQNNAEFETRLFRFGYQSFMTPQSVFDYDMATRERTLLKRTEVLGGYDPDRYQSERRYATAKDGTKIPISIL